MISKSQQIRDALALGDQIGALRIAARLFDRSSITQIYKRGIELLHNLPRTHANPHLIAGTKVGAPLIDLKKTHQERGF